MEKLKANIRKLKNQESLGKTISKKLHKKLQINLMLALKKVLQKEKNPQIKQSVEK